MRRLTLLGILVWLVAVCTVAQQRPQLEPANGKNAPDFTANDQNGNAFKLSSQRGKWVLLYFYRGYW
jgi:cytochrome oxidase Cu insertion factor (SCO1/SenC/PrrC family)